MPDDLLRLANDDVNIALIAGRAVIIEAVTELTVTANHVRGFHVNSRRRVVSAAACPADFRHGHVDVSVLRVIHEHDAAREPGRDDSATDDHAVAIVNFTPVIVLDADFRRVFFVEPNGLPAAE